MTLPTKTLLSQLRKTVEWMRLQIEYIPGCGGTDAVHDHEAAALDIIEELEGRETCCSDCEEARDWTGLAESESQILAWYRAHLRRLHDLIKGSAPKEAMDLIRAMIGEE